MTDGRKPELVHALGGPTTTTASLGHGGRSSPVFATGRRYVTRDGGGLNRELVLENDAVVFCWTSRLGHTYQRRPPAIIEPLPDPIPRDRPPYPLTIPPDDGWEDTEIWENPPPEPEPEPPPEPDPNDDIPPF